MHPWLLLMDMPGSDDAFGGAVDQMRSHLYCPDAVLVVIEGDHGTGTLGDQGLILELREKHVPFRLCFTRIDKVNADDLDGSLQGKSPQAMLKDLHQMRIDQVIASNKTLEQVEELSTDRSWLFAYPPPQEKRRCEDFFEAHGASVNRTEDVLHWLRSMHIPDIALLTRVCCRSIVDPKMMASGWLTNRWKQRSSDPHPSASDSTAEQQVSLLRECMQSCPVPAPVDRAKWGVHDGHGVWAVRERCDVQLFADAHAYFEEVERRISGAQRMVLITGWDFNPHLVLKRSMQPQEEPEQTLGDLLQKKAREGVDVRVMVWKPTSMDITITYHETKAYSEADDSGIKWCLADNNRPWAAASTCSHHQKAVVCDVGDRDVRAFVGGIDLAFGRYDTHEHNVAPVRDPRFLQEWYCPEAVSGRGACPQQRQPWHDIHCQVLGEIARDVYCNFAQRWNVSSRGQHPPLPVDRLPEATGGAQTLQCLSSCTFRWSVQMMRSAQAHVVSTSGEHEQGIQRAYVDTIKKAQRFIYIEQQYLISSSHLWEQADDKAKNGIAEALVRRVCERIDEGAPFHVFVVIPLYPETQWEAGGTSGTLGKDKWAGLKIMSHQFATISYMYRAIAKKLRSGSSDAMPTDYLSIMSLAQKKAAPDGSVDRNMIYVHSKLMIVDDEYVLLGSANVNERSMGGDADTELCVGAWEAAPPGDPSEANVGSWGVANDGRVREFRRQLFEEHMRGCYSTLAEPDGGAGDASPHRCFVPTQAFVRRMLEIATTNWDLYMDRERKQLRCHLVRFPVRVAADGRVTAHGLIPTASKAVGANGEKKWLHVSPDGRHYQLEDNEQSRTWLQNMTHGAGDPGLLRLTY
eukprot:TRINITY_DN11272_c0_g1_i1.p1 TRINITY_DN11272_c0_g1~~TRINITY_DN11272_c0_g1_i1.p1  ORF type:complete len:858 (+),score=201.24 TRINITY_DN11272_c0_g1_i1:2121-4694(+)